MGVEFVMLANNWTAFVEYNYIEFQKKNKSFLLNLGALNPPGGVTIGADIADKL